jgi:UDP-glucose 4-epimerase
MGHRGRAVITGGAGFIGAALARRLLPTWDVVVVDDLSTGRPGNVPEGATLLRASVTDEGPLRETFAGADVVFHLAARVSVEESVADPHLYRRVNAEGTLNVLSAAVRGGVKRVVLASTSAVYGDDPALPKREDMSLRPRSPYAATKAEAEHHALAFHEAGDVETVVLRPFNVYGPRQRPDSPYAAVVPRFIRDLLRRAAPPIYGTGRQTRDFVFVDDVADAFARAALAEDAAGEVINVASGEETDILGLYRVLCDILRCDIAPRFEAERPGDVPRSVADVEKARKLLGFTPKTDLKRGLERTVAYVRDGEGASP